MTKGERGFYIVFALSITNILCMALCWGFLLTNAIYAGVTDTDGYYPLHWITAVAIYSVPNFINGIWVFLFKDYTDAIKAATDRPRKGS